MSLIFAEIKKSLDLNDPLPFGKYIGLPLIKVIDEDIKYITWLFNSSKYSFMTDKAYAFYEKKLNEEHLKKIEEVLNSNIDFDDIPF